jgi:hypothetical protein
MSIPRRPAVCSSARQRRLRPDDGSTDLDTACSVRRRPCSDQDWSRTALLLRRDNLVEHGAQPGARPTSATGQRHRVGRQAKCLIHEPFDAPPQLFIDFLRDATASAASCAEVRQPQPGEPVDVVQGVDGHDAPGDHREGQNSYDAFIQHDEETWSTIDRRRRGDAGGVGEVHGAARDGMHTAHTAEASDAPKSTRSSMSVSSTWMRASKRGASPKFGRFAAVGTPVPSESIADDLTTTRAFHRVSSSGRARSTWAFTAGRPPSSWPMLCSTECSSGFRPTDPAS